jgi:radical SAM protein with 4Fe4S-binding SPASM domain
MACDYCPQATHVRAYARVGGPREMSFDTFARCLAGVPKGVEILFAGMAEPWLNPRATDMLLHAHDSGYRVGVYTTTFGMKPADLARIWHVPLLCLCVHLPDADGMMKLEVTDDYLAVLRLALAHPAGSHVTVIGRLHPRVREALGRDVPSDLGGIVGRAGNLKGKAVPWRAGRIKCSACGPELDHNVLLPNGDVVLCCMDYGMEHILGNLTATGYPELFRGEAYRRVREAQRDDASGDPICRRCELAVPDV